MTASSEGKRGVERLGHDAVSERSSFLVECANASDLPALEVDGTFVCLLAWDAVDRPTVELAELAGRLLDAGCVYLCTWGGDCGRVESTFDEVHVERSPGGPCVITTSNDESLDDALWFFLRVAYPDPGLADACRSAVAISIGMPECARAMRVAMQDPVRFSERVVEGGES